MIDIARRKLLTGLFCAPAIIRTPGLLMPVRPNVWTEEVLAGFTNVEGSMERIMFLQTWSNGRLILQWFKGSPPPGWLGLLSNDPKATA